MTHPAMAVCLGLVEMVAMRLQASMQDAARAYTFEVKPRWPLDAISQSV
jgi:hypothetical protein